MCSGVPLSRHLRAPGGRPFAATRPFNDLARSVHSGPGGRLWAAARRRPDGAAKFAQRMRTNEPGPV